MLDDNYISTKQKALKINLENSIYGSFAEIGAGQEVAAIFFKAGGASGTIAKTMSAYDMTFSNAIYGEEESGRYVVESRLTKMFSHEYRLLEERLGTSRGENTTFFAFADTVTTVNFKRTNQGHGWMGLRFQLSPQAPTNDAIIHVKLYDKDAIEQQQALGILGVNLIYACFFHHDNPEKMLKSLMDGLSRDRIEVDMFRLTGHNFNHVDNRLLSLQLVKNGLVDASLFGPDGRVLQASDTFYKKDVLILRGRFRPVTHVNMDMLKCGYEMFTQEKEVNKETMVSVAELTLHDLKLGSEEIDEKDFLDRVDILCSMGQTVMISNYQEYHKLVDYMSKLTKRKIGIVLGIYNLQSIFDEKYYTSLHGGILESFSKLFAENVKLYVYPFYLKDLNTFYCCKNFRLSEKLHHLFQFLLFNDKIQDITTNDVMISHIISDNVLAMIKSGQDGWERMVPRMVEDKIKDNCLFGYPCEPARKVEIEKRVQEISHWGN
jgi:hypothetical protein